jgi:integrase
VDDGIIRRNPCRIKGASQEQSAERPVLTIAEVYALADAIDQRYRALVLLGMFASLRWAERAALRPRDIDLETCTIRIKRQLIEQLGGGSAFGPAKSRAGRRTVPLRLSSHLRGVKLDPPHPYHQGRRGHDLARHVGRQAGPRGSYPLREILLGQPGPGHKGLYLGCHIRTF